MSALWYKSEGILGNKKDEFHALLIVSVLLVKQYCEAETTPRTIEEGKLTQKVKRVQQRRCN